MSGNLSGTVKVNGALIQGAKVRCYEEVTGVYVKETISDASGNFLINGLDTALQYFLVISEPSDLWEYRVSSRRTPYVIP